MCAKTSSSTPPAAAANGAARVRRRARRRAARILASRRSSVPRGGCSSGAVKLGLRHSAPRRAGLWLGPHAHEGYTMSNESRAPRLAVLIDAENASARIAEALFTEIATIGEASARRIYGDFSSAQMNQWTKVLARFAIQPQQNFANTKGKNAGDIALVIDAMDLLNAGRFDGFCLVSSDSDFTRLASRIREEGVSVYGFGEQKTPESFRDRKSVVEGK